MRVGLLAYLLHGGSGYRAAGVSGYAGHLLSALPRVASDHTYLGFVGRDAPPLRGVRPVISPLPTSYPVARIAWEQLGLPLQLRRTRVDLVHALVNVLPVLATLPAVVTVHDLAFLRYPDRFRRSRVLYLRSAVRHSVHRAAHIIAVSESTRRDVVDILGAAEQRVSVVYPGVAARFAPLPEAERSAFRRGATGGRPYILYVGTLEPRKNLDVLIRAFANVRRDLDLPHILMLVGGLGWMYGHLFDLVRASGLEHHVRFAGFVDHADLPLWYNGADLFAYPSAYEGFGFPVLEAMSCGVPTVTSSSSSLAELAGSACLTVDPGSTEALQLALTRLLTDSALREQLSRSGQARAASFTWERAALETVGVYARVMGA